LRAFEPDPADPKCHDSCGYVAKTGHSEDDPQRERWLKGLKALDDPRPTFAAALNAGEASNRRDRQSCAYFDPTAASLIANASNRPLLFNQLLYVRAHHKREVSFT
jgi:hypothetical protein